MPYGINIGKFRSRLQLQQLVETPDTFGQLGESWVTICVIWARLRPVKSEEKEVADQIHFYRMHEITMRYIPGIDYDDPTFDSTYRFLSPDGTRAFNILSFVNVEEIDRYLILQTKEIQATTTVNTV